MARHVHADVIHAWAEGEAIQYKGGINGEWKDFCHGAIGPTFNIHHEYRVKPKLVKKEGWIALFGDYKGDGFPSCCGIYPTEEACREVNNGYNDGHRVVKISWEEEVEE